jgi:hypothetical protein
VGAIHPRSSATKKVKQLNLVLVVFAVLCSGCPWPLPDRNLKEYVKEQDVVGRWNFQPESIALVVRDGFKTNPTHQYHIQFLKDGTCAFRSVVDEFQGGNYRDVKGKWKLEHDTTGGSNIKKKNTIQIDLSIANGTHTRYLNFDKVDGTLVLWQFYGDPDSWEFMEYKKAEQSPASDDLKAAPEE